MTCRSIGDAIVCTRERRRRSAPKRPRCRWPECGRYATQAGWACRAHWFKLPPNLRSRIFQADRDEMAALGHRDQAWRTVAEEGDRWVAEQLAKTPAPGWRQPELPL